VFAPLTFAGAASFQGLGDLSGGGFSSTAWGINGDGSVVIGQGQSASGNEAFCSTADGMAGLGDLPGGAFSSAARGVSDDGNVVVGLSTSGSGTEAFRWTSNDGMIGLGDLPGGVFASQAFAASANGGVVVGYSYGASGSEAFRWTNAQGMVGLGELPGGSGFSIAQGISDDGSVVVGYSGSALGNEAFRWTSQDGMVGLGFSVDSVGISDDGLVVFGSSSGEAFRWSDGGGMEGLGDLPGGSETSIAYASNSNGSIVVGVGNTDSGNAAFIWDEVNGMRDLKQALEDDYGLDLTGWTLSAARGMSDDGNVITGSGTNPDGDGEAWIAILDAGTAARVASFTVQTGTHISGNTADLRESDNEFLKIDAAFIEGGSPPYQMIVEVKLKTDVIDPTSIHILVEGKLSQNGGTAKLYLRNWTQGGWTLIANDPIGKTEMTQKAGGLDPSDYINASGVMKLRIKHTKTTSSNGDPFRSLIDHVQALVR
jgi:probable HAF family extracellular repeat protein